MSAAANPSSDTDLARVNQRLSELVPGADVWPAQLHSAQRHALLGPGKRFRPRLCLLVASGLGADGSAVLDTACVSEMVHAASLILDDLPCMDDASLRRNRPTTHLAFSESTAILSATALLNHAFGVLMRMDAPAAQKVELGDMLSDAVGSHGLIAGQVADLANDNQAVGHAKVERVNALKTGALFDFSVDAAAVLGSASRAQREALGRFSHQIGLAFQLLDDLKDVLLSDAEAQKSTGRDTGKATLVHLDGVAEARQRLEGYQRAAKAAVSRAELSNAEHVVALLDMQFARI